jgi:hypothetical protein
MGPDEIIGKNLQKQGITPSPSNSPAWERPSHFMGVQELLQNFVTHSGGIYLQEIFLFLWMTKKL